MKKSMSKILSFVLSAVMIFGSVVSFKAYAAEKKYEGTCGDDISWTIYSDGLLDIVGTGDIIVEDEFDENTWRIYPQSVTSVKISDGITSIPDYCFYGFGLLSTAEIPESVTEIGESAFDGCYSLKAIKLPENLEFLGNSAFYMCQKITEINIPKGIEEIGEYTFALSGLESVELHDNIKSIGKQAFSDSAVKSFNLPAKLVGIGDEAFNCENLTNITVDSGNTKFKSLDGVLFNADMTRLIKYPASKIGDSYTIPDGVTSIGTSAFKDSKNLETVKFPKSLISIGNSAFEGCTGLNDVIISDNVTTVGKRAFLGCADLKKITVPKSVIEIGKNAIGFYNKTSKDIDKIEDFVLLGYSNTAAKNYAEENSLDFLDIDSYFYNDNEAKEDEYEKHDPSHTRTSYPEFSPTCEHQGYTEGVYCEDCEMWIEGRKYIDRLSHIDNNNDGMCDICNKSMQEMAFGTIMSRFTFYKTCFNETDNNKKVPDDTLFSYIGFTGELEKYYSEEYHTYYISYSDYMSLADKYFANHSDMKDYFKQLGYFTDDTCENLAFYIGGFGDACDLMYTSSSSLGNDIYVLQGVYVDYNDPPEDNVEKYVVSNMEYYDKFGEKHSYSRYGEIFEENIFEIKVKKRGSDYQILSLNEGDWFVYNEKLCTFENEDFKVYNSFETVTDEGVSEVLCSGKPLNSSFSSFENNSLYWYDGVENYNIDIKPNDGYEIESVTLEDDNGARALTSASNGEYEIISTGNAKLTIKTCVHTHKYASEVTKNPTCTESGIKTYICNCGDSYTESIETAPHSYSSDWTVDKKATCTSAGSKSHHCTVCGAKKNVTEIKATGHSYKSKVTKKATCISQGMRTYTCLNCGKIYTESIKKLSHSYSTKWTTDKEATCTSAGSKSHHCTVCGAKKNVTEIKATGHSYTSKLTAKATASSNGKLTYTCTKCSDKYSKSIVKISSIKLSSTNFVYDGKVKTPSVTVKNSSGSKLKEGRDYTVKYESGRKNVGKYTVTVTFKDNYSGTKKLTFNIVPKGTTVSKLTAGSKKFTVKWSRQAVQTTGYQVQYSTSSSMTGSTIKTYSKTGTLSATINGLKSGKTYYVSIRTYKTVGGEKIYSSWSTVKSVKVK